MSAAMDTAPAPAADPVTDPALLDGGSVAGMLGHGVMPSVVKRLILMPRFAPRIAELVDGRLGPLPPRLEPGQRALLGLDRFAMVGFLMRAGSVWFARRIGRRIDGASVRALVGATGLDLRNFALLRRDLSPEEDGLELESDADESEAIAAALEPQGVACLKAWCMQQPKEVALRLELRLPRRPTPGPAHLRSGPAIVGALLAAKA